MEGPVMTVKAGAMSTQHTPTPWTSADGNCVNAPNGILIGGFYSYKTPGKANTAFCLRAVNAHDEMLAALRELQSAAQAAWNKGWEHDTLARNRLAEQIHRARAAITKATEVQS